MNTLIRSFTQAFTFWEDCKGIARELRSTLPERFDTSYAVTNNFCVLGNTNVIKVKAFLTIFSEIERLYFKDDIEKTVTTNRNTLKSPGLFFANMEDFDPNYKTGLVIETSPRTKYEENENFKHLEAAEATLKAESHHFLKIFTYKGNNILYVYTNKPLDYQTVLKLKELQKQIFKEAYQENEYIEQVFNAFKEESVDKINEALEKFFNQSYLLELKYSGIKSLFKSQTKRRIKNLEEDLNRHENDYLYYENTMSNLITRIRDIQKELDYLYDTKEDDGDAEMIIKYLNKHPYIKQIKIRPNESAIELFYETPIIYFDKYLIKKIISRYTDTKRKILQIFLDNKYEFMTRCRIRFHTNNFEIHPDSYGASRFFPHPHLEAHHCTGSHTSAIKEAAKTGNYIGAIEQITQATMNINFADTYVVNWMLDRLTDMNYMVSPLWRNKETGEIKSTEEVLTEYEETETTA